MSAVFGYLRVSGTDQVLDLQRDALAAAGCSRVWTDTASGATTSRPQLNDLLSHLREGDTLVVWRLGRLGRSLPHLLQTVEDLDERGVGFRSLTESIDTTASGGKLIFSIFGALAEFELLRSDCLRLALVVLAEHCFDAIQRALAPVGAIQRRSPPHHRDLPTPAHPRQRPQKIERNLIRERAEVGLAAARARGRIGGRPPKMTANKIRQAHKMRENGMPLVDIAEILGVGRTTLYRHLK